MRRSVRSQAAVMLLAAALASSATTPASARGAAATIMNSPGYQRALEDSRKRYQQSAEPRVQPLPAHKRNKKPRHSGRH